MSDSNPFARAIASGLLVVAAAIAQGGAPKALPLAAAAKPAVTVLGEVEVNAVAMVGEISFLDVARAARMRPGAALDAILVARCTESGFLLVRVDLEHMLKTGSTRMNIQLVDGDFLLVPRRVDRAKPLTELELIDAVVRETLAEHWPAGRRGRFAACRLLAEKDAVRRQGIVAEIGGLRAEEASAVTPLVAALGGEERIACDAATALGLLGVSAVPALPDLKERIRVGGARLRACCTAAVAAIEKAVSKQSQESQPK